MEQQKKIIVGLLLMLYLIVLAHGSIAHNYDCEILKKRLVNKTSDQSVVSFQMGMLRWEDNHFDVFSDNVGIKTKKQIVVPDYVLPGVYVVSPLCLPFSENMCRFFYSYNIQSFYFYFTLRSPPSMS